MKIDVNSSKSSISAPANPYELFAEWFRAAGQTEPEYPDAFTLATVREDGFPDARVVLLKEWDERGFVFYTNFESAKGRALRANPLAAMCIHWKTQQKQIRVRGSVEEVSAEQADAYYNSRPRLSRIGAWASRQSTEITGRAELVQSLKEIDARYPGEDVPRPPHWSGFRIVPAEIEFWSEGEYRLHDRVLYRRAGDQWQQSILSP